MDAIDHKVVKKIIVESAQNKFDDARTKYVTSRIHSTVMICMSLQGGAHALHQTVSIGSERCIVAAEGYARHDSNVKCLGNRH